MVLAECKGHGILRLVHILALVHYNVRIPVRHAFAKVVVLLKERHDVQNEVVELAKALFGLCLLIATPHARELDILRRAVVPIACRSRAGVLMIGLKAQERAHSALKFGGASGFRKAAPLELVGKQRELDTRATQNLEAQRVHGRYLDAGDALLGEHLPDPGLHLSGRVVGEGGHEQAASLLGHPCGSERHDARLAAAGAGVNGRGAILMQHRVPLPGAKMIPARQTPYSSANSKCSVR